MKFKEKIEAVRLRRLGRSYAEIRKKVRASKSTLSMWLKDIRLSKKQKNRLYITLRQKKRVQTS